jgi:hypothetical protein
LLALLVAPAAAILVTQAFLKVNNNYETGAFLFAASIAPIPIAVGIAILRYRLYDIDLIINRTLVYVPLTGIVTGLYSASVALFQKLFQALTGENSDAAIVISTLILASLFTPMKNGLQSLVDRRFKEESDSTRKLKALGEQARSVLEVVDAEQATRRLLDEATPAFGATGGAISLWQGGKLKLVHTSGQWNDGDPKISVPLEHDGKQLGLLQLGPRRSGSEYTEQDRETLQEVTGLVAGTISLMRALDGR